MFRVSASGGDPEQLTTLEDGEFSHRFPHFLPDGQGVVFTVYYRDDGRPTQVAVYRFDAGQHQVVAEGTRAHVTATGHLVFGGSREDTLWAVSFDADGLTTRGDAVLMVEGLRSYDGIPFHALGADGTLVYLTREFSEDSQLVWVDRNGQEEVLSSEPGPYFLPRVSPDGQRVAVELRELDDTDIWVYDLASATLQPVTSEPGDETYPLWTPDGRDVLFASRVADAFGVYRRSTYGTGVNELLSESSSHRHPLGWAGPRLIVGEVGRTADCSRWKRRAAIRHGSSMSSGSIGRPCLQMASGLPTARSRRARRVRSGCAP